MSCNYLFIKIFLWSVMLSYCLPAPFLCVNYVTVCSFCCSWVKLSSKINHLTLSFQVVRNKYAITSFLFYDYHSFSLRPLSLEFFQTSNIWESERNVKVLQRYVMVCFMQGFKVCFLCSRISSYPNLVSKCMTIFSLLIKLPCIPERIRCCFLILLIQAHLWSEFQWTTSWAHIIFTLLEYELVCRQNRWGKTAGGRKKHLSQLKLMQQNKRN